MNQMFKCIIIITLFFVLAPWAIGQPKPVELEPGYEHDKYVTEPQDIISEFRAYTSSFDSDDEHVALAQPEWVAYELRKAPRNLGKPPDRPSWFTDPVLFAQGIAPSNDSYKHSNYSRGHMCMKHHAWRLGANADWNTHTFLNVCPQLQGMNAGVWLHLENLCSEWADKYDQIWIVCGPVFFQNRPTSWIGDDNEVPVAIPDAFFKIVIRQGLAEDQINVLAFIMPNDDDRPLRSKTSDLTPYLTSVDVIEALTDLDLLTVLEDEYEDSIERKIATTLWPSTSTQRSDTPPVEPTIVEPAQPVPVITLRSGIQASSDETELARAIKAAGWKYVMPRPKSAQASWGNSDGRTTWWNGYWTNSRTNRISARQPKAINDFAGDGQDNRGWRRGGAPRRPTVVEWLCSDSGGIPPR